MLVHWWRAIDQAMGCGETSLMKMMMIPDLFAIAVVLQSLVVLAMAAVLQNLVLLAMTAVLQSFEFLQLLL